MRGLSAGLKIAGMSVAQSVDPRRSESRRGPLTLLASLVDLPAQRGEVIIYFAGITSE